MSMLPLIVWCLAAVLSLAVCGVCVMSGALMPGDGRSASMVSWSVTGMHFMSVIAAAGSYLLFIVGSRRFSASMNGFYRSVGVVSAVIIVALILAQLVLIVLQARKAQHEQMDRVLSGVAERNHGE
ncbi:MAG: hypothetical protein LKI88_01055 [Bifidobacterium sp.]|jgi:magnesium-transporting ATPase (P-type)|nr:hypothetical protein [Bifidobacterium sp.]